MKTAIAEHLYSVIDRATVVTDPFPYLYVRDVLPEAYYRDLIAGLPENNAYERFPAPYESRLGLELSTKVVDKFPVHGRAVWEEFEAWIHSQQFLDKVVGKFQPYLRANKSYRKKQLKKAAVGSSEIRVEPRSLLVRDYSNFAITPHTDSASKTVVGAFYLPKDDSQKPFGTSFYRPRNAAFSDWDSERFDYSDFEVAFTAEYVPNSMLLFMKSDKSFHGVEMRQYSDIGRDVLFWTPAISAKERSGNSLLLPTEWFAGKRSLLDNMKKLFG
jgi:hypothetical protein